MEQLSRIYDCDVDRTSTIRGGDEYPEDTFQNFASATTPYIFTMMDETFFLQGTGNRILWLIDLIKEAIKDIDKDVDENAVNFFYSLGGLEKDTQYTDTMVHKLMRIRMLKEGLVQVNIVASAILYRFRDECYNQSVGIFNKNNLDIESSYISRLAENSMRLALIHCIGRKVNKTDSIEVDGCLVQSDTDGHLIANVKDVEGVTDFQIIEEDALWAVDLMKYFHQSYLDMWKLSSTTRPITSKTYKNDYDRIASVIEKKDGRATFRQIKDRTAIEDLQKLLDSMIQMHRIRLSTEKNNSGQVITYYRIVAEDDPFRESDDFLYTKTT
jgi:hypothetical protein